MAINILSQYNWVGGAFMPVISNAQVRGFRLQNHHLAQSQPISALSTIVGACGLQNTPLVLG